MRSNDCRVFERRPLRQEAVNPFKRGADRTRFVEFFAELDAKEAVATDRGDLRRPDQIYPGRPNCRRDIDNFKAAALKNVKVERLFFPLRRRQA